MTTLFLESPSGVISNGGKLTEYRYGRGCAESRYHAATPASRGAALQPAADRRTGEPWAGPRIGRRIARSLVARHGAEAANNVAAAATCERAHRLVADGIDDPAEPRIRGAPWWGAGCGRYLDRRPDGLAPGSRA